MFRFSMSSDPTLAQINNNNTGEDSLPAILLQQPTQVARPDQLGQPSLLTGNSARNIPWNTFPHPTYAATSAPNDAGASNNGYQDDSTAYAQMFDETIDYSDYPEPEATNTTLPYWPTSQQSSRLPTQDSQMPTPDFQRQKVLDAAEGAQSRAQDLIGRMKSPLKRSFDDSTLTEPPAHDLTAAKAPSKLRVQISTPANYAPRHSKRVKSSATPPVSSLAAAGPSTTGPMSQTGTATNHSSHPPLDEFLPSNVLSSKIPTTKNTSGITPPDGTSAPSVRSLIMSEDSQLLFSSADEARAHRRARVLGDIKNDDVDLATH